MVAELSIGRAPAPNRLRISVRGAVQGVGFRPFIYRLATELGLRGWVNNSAQGVWIEVEGDRHPLDQFLLRLEAEKPPRSFIQSLESTWLDAVGYPNFEIRPSAPGGEKTALVLPDIATCPECAREIFDVANRRYFYPFTNCTNCGPRFSIINALPYDRANTSMKAFAMCPECQAEYGDPRDRRFHAQPNACPVCGPQIALWDGAGQTLVEPNPSPRDVLGAAATAIRAGKIVAVKGLGGFQLMVAAHDDQAVARLRVLKHREEKPFAIMVPSMEAAAAICAISPAERRLLLSPEAPIVLLRRLSQPSPRGPSLSGQIAPGNPYVGVMLPYTPLHHLLLSLMGAPVVATSGNLKDEPICVDEREALERLGNVADAFLVHNRPIMRHVDDSVVRMVAGRELVLRRARGFAPLPFTIESRVRAPRGVLGVGAHLKNTVALGCGQQVFVSQHIGDLETDQAFTAFRRVIQDFEMLFEVSPGTVVADAHPDYLSTKFAQELVAQRASAAAGVAPTLDRAGPELLQVQHHFAHVLSCMAENEIEPPLLGVSWDGTGYGLDGTVWGGEFFCVDQNGGTRTAHLRPFRLAGGDKAVREPRRSALGVLFELFGEKAFPQVAETFLARELAPLSNMLRRGINSPLTSSAGRLFDAVAALTGLRQEVRFEGQAAMELEFALEGTDTREAYPLPLKPSGEGARQGLRNSPMVLDWSELIQAVLEDARRETPLGLISARFHNGLVEGIVAVARHLELPRVAVTGGCFQNRYLTERASTRLAEEGFTVYRHQRIPPNDGGIALGQVFAAVRQISLRGPLPRPA